MIKDKLAKCPVIIANILFLTLFSVTGVPAQPSAPSSDKQLKRSLIFAAPPLPDNIGEPGRREEAGKRGCQGAEQSSASEKRTLTALVPVSQVSKSELVSGITTATHPTFWFYVPYQSPLTVKFVLRDQADNLVYETTLTLLQTPGVVSFSLPATEPPLNLGESYHWYFKIYCQTKPPPLFVDGWIQRTSLNVAIQRQLEQATLQERLDLYASNGVWYEALTTAYKLHRADPKDESWTVLLQSVGIENIPPAPMGELIPVEVTQ